ncbi:MAG: universal stress protein [Pyrinomonadaceae bacterium]|nr:universal stress protein [Pyrinomonadaceae bacterium]
MRILLAVDGSEFSFAAARKCCEMIRIDENTEVRIVSVIETITPAEPFGMSDEYLAIAQKAARGVAEQTLEDTRQTMYKLLSDIDLDIETRSIEGKPKEAILDEAKKWEADLIVLGSQGRGFWGRMLLGSVSSAVVKYAPCSVLVVRTEAAGNEK